MYRTDNLVT